MNKLVVVPLLALMLSCATRAQQQSATFSSLDSSVVGATEANQSALDSQQLSLGFPVVDPRPLLTAANSQARLNIAASVWMGATSSSVGLDRPTPAAVVPDPSPAPPEPRFVFGGRDDFRWQMGLGFSVVRFRSQFYYATGIGTSTSISYYTNDWFGIEGRISTSFAPTIYLNEHVKFVGYGFGPKLAWRQRKFEPFVHAMFGGVHILPQTAAGSANGFEFQAGGGAGYRFNPRLSTRLVADWVRTRLWGQWQDNAQLALEAVLHF